MNNGKLRNEEGGGSAPGQSKNMLVDNVSCHEDDASASGGLNNVTINERGN